MPAHFPLSPQSSVLSPRRAFTFLEVLFAVIIVGVGVILIAGMFPVAIEQSQANLAESAGVAVGRDAMRYIQSVTSCFAPLPAAGPACPLLPCTMDDLGATPVLAANSLYPIMPLPNTLVTVAGAQYAQSNLIPKATTLTAFLAHPSAAALGGGQTMTGDKRYGWIGFYRRDMIATSDFGGAVATPAPYAQVWIIAAQATAEGQASFTPLSAITPAVLAPPTNSPNFQPIALSGQTVSIAYTLTNGTIIELPDTATMAAPNAFVLILNATDVAVKNTDTNLIGQYVRLGSALGPDKTGKYTFWTLLPGSDLNTSDKFLNPAATYSIGANSVGTLTGTTISASVFILGAPPAPTGGGVFINAGPLPVAPSVGPAQDVTAITGFVRVGY